MGNICAGGESSSSVEAPRGGQKHPPGWHAEYLERKFDLRWVNTGQKLGSGGFSDVYLIKHRKTGQLAACKIMKKKGMKAEDLKSVESEVAIMRKLQHPHIVKFIDYFDETDYVYVVLENMEGGALFDRVVTKNSYNEKDARDLMRIMLVALKSCHDKNIVHRDIKPENMLLTRMDNDSDVKIADFGLSIELKPAELAFHACGTPNYIAPEMLKKEGYGMPVDMWAVGCVTFILLGGYAPFDTEGDDAASMKKMYKAIRAGKYEFEKDYFDNVSDDAKNMIRGLLEKDPSKRLTCEQALQSPWMVANDNDLAARHLDKNLKNFRAFLGKRKFKAAVRGIIATNKFKKIVASIKDGAFAADKETKEAAAKEEQEAQELRASIADESSAIGLDAPIHPDDIDVADSQAPEEEADSVTS